MGTLAARRKRDTGSRPSEPQRPARLVLAADPPRDLRRPATSLRASAGGASAPDDRCYLALLIVVSGVCALAEPSAWRRR